MTWRFLPFVVLVALPGCGGSGSAANNPLAPSGTSTGSGTQATTASLPTGLTMPIRVDDINLRGVINPFGVVRSSLDLDALGAPGH